MGTDAKLAALRAELAALKSRLRLMTVLQDQNRVLVERNRVLEAENASLRSTPPPVEPSGQVSVTRSLGGGSVPSAYVTEPTRQAAGDSRVSVMLALTKRIHLHDFEFEKISVTLESPCKSDERGLTFVALRDEARRLLEQHLQPPDPGLDVGPVNLDDLPFDP